MTWTEPTQKQYELAVTHGIEYALDQIKNGNEGPQESPLSGEWADGLTPRAVAQDVGYYPGLSAISAEQFDEAATELADAWEQGYNDTWRTYLDNIQRPRG